jgi:chemotaxis protein methyltransferase CheR
MMDADLAFLRGFVRQRSGISLGSDKGYLLESRLGPLSKAAGLDGISGVVAVLRERPDDALARQVVDAMATHETLFFRDRVPFDVLRDVVLPKLAAARPPGQPLRIWSAAASTGQEAYSVAMLVQELGSGLGGRNVEILGTDISEAAIARARSGLFSQFEVQRGLSIRSLLDHFKQTEAGWEIRPALRKSVEFRVFNLLDDVRPLGRFDVILCRNLLIYFDTAAKQELLGKMADALAPGGALCLGAAESAYGLTTALAPHPGVPGYFIRAQERSGTASSLPGPVPSGERMLPGQPLRPGSPTRLAR